MTLRSLRLPLSVLALGGLAWTTHFLLAQSAPSTAATPAAPTAAAPQNTFDQQIKPFLQKNCVQCHNADNMTAGVRVDHLDATFEDKQIRFWEGIRHRVENGTMPPKGLPQPTAAERKQVTDWIGQGLEVARLRPAPKNGLVRRLTVAQYRNTLRELLQLEDDLTEILPPDAISADGFVNNKDTLQLSPLLLEAYFEIADEALNRAIVDPQAKPKIQNFRVDLGADINKNPIPDKLILGANSLLLENQDFTVTELTPQKPFAFEPFRMRTKYRFIEGYAGNDTVRGWREFDSIYHSVFACMRGKFGYPKGMAYGTVPEGLVLRPSIPTEEMFDADGTYGPAANFKISLRELPDNGRFRVTVTAAKYNDGLLLDPGATPGTAQPTELKAPATSVVIPQAGIYQVDAYQGQRPAPPAPDRSRLSENLAASFPLNGPAGETLEGKAHFVDSPFGKALSLDEDTDFATVPRQDAFSVGTGDFTVSAWIKPTQLRRGGIVVNGGSDWTQGWFLDMADGKGSLRFESLGPEGQPNGTVTAPQGSLRVNEWQQVTAVIRRGHNQARLYVDGYLVGQGSVGPASLDNAKVNLQIGKVAKAPFRGQLDEVRLYRRALSEAEIQALVEPGRQFAKAPVDKPQELTLTLGSREFTSILKQPAFVLVRLPAGPLPVKASLGGIFSVDRVVFTPASAALAQRFTTFEKRSPRVGVYAGLRRDCGSTLAPVGQPQTVSSTQPTRFIYEGAIRNYPSPDVEKDNVNYLAGVREIGVRSEYTDGRDMPRVAIRSIEFEGPFYETWPPPSHKSIFIDSTAPKDSPAYARQIIRRFATRAYRRPVTPAEETSLMAVFEKSTAAGAPFRQAVKDSLQVALTSPQFLFLTETSSTPKPEQLDNYELASKLAYFLTNSPPDATTLQLASAGTLRQQLGAEVDRLVASAKFTNFNREFATQWLALDKIAVLEPDRKRYPRMTRDARVHLREEPIAFVEYLMRNNLPVRNLIDSDFIVANEVVATYYDLGAQSESGLKFLPIVHRRPNELGGVMTQAAIMAGLSDGRESNPVKRGAWLARRIIAEPPPPPPPNVPALKEEESNLTLRQRLEQHRNQNGCRQCHAKIDPWGVALEEYDAGGRKKAGPVDASSQLPDLVEVAGAADLKRHLSQDRIDQVAFSFYKHIATYATGRSLTYNELNYLKQQGPQLKATGYRMKDMIRFVVNSPLFLEK